MAICFRQMAQYTQHTQRWFLVMCLVIAAATLFTNFRYVRRYRGICNSIQQMQQPAPKQ